MKHEGAESLALMIYCELLDTRPPETCVHLEPWTFLMSMCQLLGPEPAPSMPSGRKIGRQIWTNLHFGRLI